MIWKPPTAAPQMDYQDVNDGAALARFFGAEEQPVLADGRGPKGILQQVQDGFVNPGVSGWDAGAGCTSLP